MNKVCIVSGSFRCHNSETSVGGCIKQALIGIIIQHGCLLSCVVVYVERFGLRDELDMHCSATVQHDL